MAHDNFGIVIKKAGVALGEVTKAAVPEIIQDSVETTSHDTVGWRDFVPSGLKSLEPFEITMNSGSTVFESIYSDMTGKTSSIYSIEYPDSYLTTWSFTAFPVSIKLGDMDAASPGNLELIVKFQASGSLTA